MYKSGMIIKPLTYNIPSIKRQTTALKDWKTTNWQLGKSESGVRITGHWTGLVKSFKSFGPIKYLKK